MAIKLERVRWSGFFLTDVGKFGSCLPKNDFKKLYILMTVELKQNGTKNK